jgi:hypothetical protein
VRRLVRGDRRPSRGGRGGGRVRARDDLPLLRRRLALVGRVAAARDPGTPRARGPQPRPRNLSERYLQRLAEESRDERSGRLVHACVTPTIDRAGEFAGIFARLAAEMARVFSWAGPRQRRPEDPSSRRAAASRDRSRSEPAPPTSRPTSSSFCFANGIALERLNPAAALVAVRHDRVSWQGEGAGSSQSSWARVHGPCCPPHGGDGPMRTISGREFWAPTATPRCTGRTRPVRTNTVGWASRE